MDNYVVGQIEHELVYSYWVNSRTQTQEVTFYCVCKAWKMLWILNPREAFVGKTLTMPGRSMGEECLKAGINAGREFQCHLDTSQVDVVLWAGQDILL